MEKIKILIVEDDPIIATDLSFILSDMGYQPMEIMTNGEEALALIEIEQPELILMDIQLDGPLDGIETSQQIQKKWDIPIIYLSSNTDSATFSKAKTTNPLAFLSKPFREKDLKHSIELALYQKSKAKEESAPEMDEDTFVLEDRIFIRHKGRLIRVYLADILYLQADNVYTNLVVKNKTYLLSTNLKKMETLLKKFPKFLRVHRSYIINLNQVEEIAELALFIYQHKIPIGRSYKEDLRKRLPIFRI